MPRTARASAGGLCYHVLNRGNARAQVFHYPSDYLEFIRSLERACEVIEMRVLGFCLMPNHFHLVLWPREDGDLSTWMQRLLNSHVQRHRRRHRSTGHIWQGRFKAFPIKEDVHLLTVLRYVERNPVRASLVSRAEDWAWSSMRLHANVLLLSPVSSGSKSQPPQPTAARGPCVRCDYYVFMTAVVDIGLVTKKCLCFTNLQT